MRRRSSLLKAAILLAALVGLAFLFLRTVRNAGSQPYIVRQDWLHDWKVAAAREDPQGTVIGLRPPPDLTSDLFRQVFKRTMASLSSPATPQMPLILASEIGPGAARALAMDDLEAAARAAGLEAAVVTPRCLAMHRISSARSTLEYYFVLFDVPGFDRFRQGARDILAKQAGSSSGFDPDALAPVLLVAGSESAIRAPLPFRPDPDRDCVAPIVVE